MAHFAHTSTTAILAFLSFLLLLPHSYSSIPKSDVDLLEFPLNLEYLEAEFFLYGSLGFGLDKVASNLTLGACCGSFGCGIRTRCVIRTLLYKNALVRVHPYGITVVEFTNWLSDLRNKLGQTGSKDEGPLVPKYKGAEGNIIGNVLAGTAYSVAYDRSHRTPEEILRIVYGSGDEHVPGGFYHKGADGRIAKSHLQNGTGRNS
ncbi:hypothetical protein RchiOBHm_Chr4g0426051 [Rosa chinensis]|uniref:Uncharacterized protein n=1 Tax=Rosa chinensis TaxID=74649 RepID=A0A2P6QZ98_ROSCH|nr:hypothetical protein RchiOBHm_Chr4g0426051 [Rosa chinensis]